jgi:DNA-binding NarL/FixJ family response regulator
MRVILADDHSLFRDGIASLLEQADYQIIAQVDNGRDAIEATRKLKPDLLLLDLLIGEVSGLEALQTIKAELPKTFVVILTVSDADQDLFAAIRAGADGYILKEVKADEFLDLLGGLARGEVAINRKTATRLVSGYQTLTKQKETQGKLSSRELETLELLGRGFSNRVIAERMFISENTVKYHIRNIMQKLNVQNRTEAVALALHEGLIEKK